jgi:hypothetical protein
MEDYVATDARPLDACLADVGGCDLYVGLIAFRYGHVPSHDNPRGLSVTELEYRHARALGKTCFVFLARQAGWDSESHDKVTGDGDAGARVGALRAELEEAVLTDWFTTPEQAAMAVQASVSQWLVQHGAGPAEPRAVAQPAAPQPKQTPLRRLRWREQCPSSAR